MPLPPVVVEIGDAQLTPELRQTVLRACTRAVKDGECVDAEQSSTPEPRAVAILSWSDDGSVRIQVGLREPPRWRTRSLHFAAEDEPEEICTAVGFAAGTLATTLELGDEGEEVAAPPPATAAEPAAAPRPTPPPRDARGAASPVGPTPPSEAREPESSRGPVRFTADVTVLGGTGVERDAPRLGPRLTLSLWGDRPWSLALRGDVAWVVRAPLGMSYLVAGGALGPGGYLGVGELRLTVRALLGADFIRAKVSDPVTGRSDEAGRWLGMGAVGGDVEWPCTSPARAVIGGEAVWPFGTTDVQVAGVAREAAVRLHGAGTVGIRLGATCSRR